jgi:hypothetical protein
VSPVRYEIGFYIPEDDILHSHCRDNVKYYTAAVWAERQAVNHHAEASIALLNDSKITQNILLMIRVFVK